MRNALLPLILAATLQAGVMDFKTLSEARSAYEQGDFNTAAERYAALKEKNAQACFNYADALYKQEKYAEAAAVFEGIDAPELRQQALHNLGNSLAMEGKTDEAISAYEKALEMGEDDDTRYNLELLKKQQEQQQDEDRQDQDDKNQDQNRSQNDQQQQQGQDQNQNDQQQDGQDQQQQQNGNEDASQKKSDDRKGQHGEQDEKPQQDSSEQQENEGQNASESSSQSDQQAANAEKNDEKEQNTQQGQAAMAEPISDMEERKYNQMLDGRGIKTLMIPLSGKGEPHEDETTPW